MSCLCGHPDHIATCEALCLGIARCGCARLPEPTDDELLKAFVDECPNMAIDEYRRRVGLDWRLTPIFIFDHLQQEWNRRMNGTTR